MPLAASQRIVALLVLCALAAAPAPSPVWTGVYDQQPLDASSAPATQPAGATVAPTPAAPSGGLGATRVALALGIVLLVIVAVRAVAKRFLPATVGGAAGMVKVLSRTPLAPRQQVVLLLVGRRVVVVGDSGGRLSPLAEIADPDEVALLLGRAAGAVGSEGDALTSDNLEAAPAFSNLFAARREPYDAAARADAAGADAGAELGGLADRVKLLSAQFRRG